MRCACDAARFGDAARMPSARTFLQFTHLGRHTSNLLPAIVSCHGQGIAIIAYEINRHDHEARGAPFCFIHTRLVCMDPRTRKKTAGRAPSNPALLSSNCIVHPLSAFSASLIACIGQTARDA